MESTPEALRSAPDTCGNAFEARGELCALQVVLFQDAFVCRHVNKANQWVEGFAQPYDAESRYFLACVDKGLLPDGLSDLIALRPRDGSVLVEVRDYRSSADQLCPVSSVFLSCGPPMTLDASSSKNSSESSTCRLWRNVLHPPKGSVNGSHSSSNVLGLDPAADNTMLPFDESIAMSQDQLEALAMDATPLFLESEIMSPRLMDVEPFPSSPFLSATPTESSAGALAKQPPRQQLLAWVQPHQSSGSHLQARATAWQAAPARTNSVDSSAPRERGRESEMRVAASDCGSTGAKLSELRITVPRDDMDFEDALSDTLPVERLGTLRHSQLENASRMSAEYQQSPLPGTFPFIEKLKGKKRRRISVPAELSYGSPSWRSRGRIDHFFRAATFFERKHAISLQINMRRLTRPDSALTNEPQFSPGKMPCIAHELQDWRMPTEVIAARAASRQRTDKQLTREFMRSAMANPSLDPVFSVAVEPPSSLLEALQL